MTSGEAPPVAGTPDAARPDLARAAAAGVAWQGASFLVGKLLVLVTTIVLARLLAEEAFGLVAMALLFVSYAEMVADLGVAQALVFLPLDRRGTDAAIGLSLATSAVLVAGAFLAAPAVARFFGEPDVAPMLRAFSLSLLLSGAGQVPDALLRKALEFRRRMWAQVSRSAVQGAVSIGLALAGFDAWSIVWGYLAGTAAWTVALWAMAGHRPGAGIVAPRAEAGPLLRFGLPAAGNAILLALIVNVDYLVVGRRLGAEALGFYTVAFRIPELLVINVFHVIGAVAFPVWSLVREDPAQVRRGYLRSVRLQAVYGMAAGAAIAASAPMLVRALFGERWMPAVPALQALALYAAFRSLGLGAVELFKGVGRPGLALGLSLARLAVLLPALLLVVGSGIEAVAWTQAVVAAVLAVATQALAGRVVGLPLSRFAEVLRPGLAAAAGAGLAGLAVREWLPVPAGIGLLVAGVASLAGAAGALHLADRRFLPEAWALLRRPPATARLEGNA